MREMRDQEVNLPCIGPIVPDDSPLSARLFDHCAPHIQAALDRDFGSHTVGDVWDAVRRGSAQLWVTPRSALVTAIEASPRKKMFFFWLAGGDLDELLAVEAPACAWAKAQGCDQAWVTGRRGWLKALDGYREGATMMVRDL